MRATQFKKGVSGNPKGRARLAQDAVSVAHALAAKAVQGLWDMANDRSLPANVRRQCFNDVLDRSLGKVTKSVAIGIQNLNPPESTVDPLDAEMAQALDSAKAGIIPTQEARALPLLEADPFAVSIGQETAISGQENTAARINSVSGSQNGRNSTNEIISDFIKSEIDKLD